MHSDPESELIHIAAATVRFAKPPRELAGTFDVCIPSLLNKGVEGERTTTQGIWDTGATNSCVSSALVQELGLRPIARGKTLGLQGIQEVNVYLVNIYLHATEVAFKMLRVHEVELPSHGLIIGMDIIAMGDFAITHTPRETIFSFRCPTLYQPIDYRREIEDYLKANPDAALGPGDKKKVKQGNKKAGPSRDPLVN